MPVPEVPVHQEGRQGDGEEGGCPLLCHARCQEVVQAPQEYKGVRKTAGIDHQEGVHEDIGFLPQCPHPHLLSAVLAVRQLVHPFQVGADKPGHQGDGQERRHVLVHRPAVHSGADNQEHHNELEQDLVPPQVSSWLFRSTYSSGTGETN